MSERDHPRCLAIGGLDPSGGAGLIADIRAFQAFGCDAAAVVTSVTHQNSKDFFGSEHQTAESVRRQLEAAFAEGVVVAVKTGMLPTPEIVEVVADHLKGRNVLLVVDPVIRSSTGHELASSEAVAAMKELLFPLATLITPNIPEAEQLTSVQIRSEEDARVAGNVLLDLGTNAVLIKGGHAAGAMTKGCDLLFTRNGLELFDAEQVDVEMRGTGCMLASAIAGNLALGNELSSSVRRAKDFLARLFAERVTNG